MKRASYRAGVEWIAANDAPGDAADVNTLTGYVSVALLADLFGVEPERVARRREKDAERQDRDDRLSAEMEQDYLAQHRDD